MIVLYLRKMTSTNHKGNNQKTGKSILAVPRLLLIQDVL